MACKCGCSCCCNDDPTKRVIDISAWQEGIDLQRVKDEGIYGVIVKLGEGFRETETARDQIFGALAVPVCCAV